MSAKRKVRRKSSKKARSNAALVMRLFPLRALPPIRKLSDRTVRSLLRKGRTNADQILRARAARVRRRPAGFVAGSRGLVLCEGDSWFNYPWTTDIPRQLEEMEFEAPSVAHHGDHIEHMIGQLPDLEGLINAQTRVPKAILLCGGGNDIVENENDEFLSLLNPANSSQPGWNKQKLIDRIDGDLQRFYLIMLSEITRFCVKKWNRAIPIVIHGYANPVPDGRPAVISGPWLRETFEKRGYVDASGKIDLKICTPLMAQLIGRFNDMLSGLSTAAPGMTHVRYVDLRPAMSNGANYKKYWANELHPKRFGWAEVTKLIAAAI